MSTMTPPPPQQQSIFSTLTLENTLEDLSSRFIVNLPQEELESMERVCFQIEQAHWYYEDFIRPAALTPSLLPSFGLKQFSLLMFRSCPLLDHLVAGHAEIWTNFMAYKERVPVCGAILISKAWDKVLMVKGYTKGASWSFPRGKINKEEPEADCAIREVLEETGYDLLPHFPSSMIQNGGARIPYYVELVVKEQRIRLYFIPDVEESTQFLTQTRKEISKIDWFRVSDLPTWKNGKKVVPVTTNSKQPKYFMVTPFVSHLKLWIQKNKPSAKSASPSKRHLPPHFQQREDAASDSDDMVHYTSASEVTSEEDEGEDEEMRFESTEQGSLALEAFFFGRGGSPAAPSPVSKPRMEDTRILIDDDDATPTRLQPKSNPAFAFAAPPHSIQSPSVSTYERQQPLVQPRPQPSSRQTSLLLALLDPIPSPPPQLTILKRVATSQSSNLLDALLGSTSPPARGSSPGRDLSRKSSFANVGSLNVTTSPSHSLSRTASTVRASGSRNGGLSSGGEMSPGTKELVRGKGLLDSLLLPPVNAGSGSRVDQNEAPILRQDEEKIVAINTQNSAGLLSILNARPSAPSSSILPSAPVSTQNQQNTLLGLLQRPAPRQEPVLGLPSISPPTAHPPTFQQHPHQFQSHQSQQQHQYQSTQMPMMPSMQPMPHLQPLPFPQQPIPYPNQSHPLPPLHSHGLPFPHSQQTHHPEMFSMHPSQSHHQQQFIQPAQQFINPSQFNRPPPNVMMMNHSQPSSMMMQPPVIQQQLHSLAFPPLSAAIPVTPRREEDLIDRMRMESIQQQQQQRESATTQLAERLVPTVQSRKLLSIFNIGA